MKKSFKLLISLLILTRSLDCFCQIHIHHPILGRVEIIGSELERPFAYGLVLTKSECKMLFDEHLKILDFKKGEHVADIGAFSGHLDAIFSVFCDSVNFYLEDIDKRFLNERQLKKVTGYYNSLRSTPQTNTFEFTIGKSRRTGLPDSSFDKIMIFDSFHEFRFPKRMSADIAMKLKQGGKLYIFDSFSKRFTRRKADRCNKIAFSVEKVCAIMKKNGLYLTYLNSPEECYKNVLIFEKDSNKSKDLFRKIYPTEQILKRIGTLANANIAKDSVKVQEVADSIKNHFELLQKTYPGLELFLLGISKDWIKEGRYKEAINIYKIQIQLFPDSFFSYNELADTYLDIGEFDLALACFLKSYSLEPNNTNARIKIELLEKYKRH